MVDIVYSFIRGLDKPTILWLLYLKPRSGYELIKEFRGLTGQKLKPSVVYPFLHRLEKGGFTVSKWIEEGRRKIRYYRLTDKGEKLLDRVRNFFDMPIKELIRDMLVERSKTI